MSIAITGAHRSGTSMVARLMQACGIYLGEKDNLIPATSSNLHGHWEHKAFVQINNDILHLFGRGWETPIPIADWYQEPNKLHTITTRAKIVTGKMSPHAPWGWKDPRTSLTLPFWQNLFPNLKVIVCLRNPIEVALSLHHRNNFSFPFALKLWQSYNESVLASVAKDNLLVTHYDRYFQDPEKELKRIFSFLGILISDEKIDHACLLINKASRHHIFALGQLKHLPVTPTLLANYASYCHLANWSNKELLTHFSQGGHFQQQLIDYIYASQSEEKTTLYLDQLKTHEDQSKSIVQSLTSFLIAQSATITDLQQEKKTYKKQLGRLIQQSQALLQKSTTIDHNLADLQSLLGVLPHSQQEPHQYEVSLEVETQINTTLYKHVPPDAQILVVQCSDTKQLRLKDQLSTPFPQDSDGKALKRRLTNDWSVIAHLETLRALGAKYLLFPAHQLYWFERYPRFKHYLEQRYTLVTAEEGSFYLFNIVSPLSQSNDKLIWHALQHLLDSIQTEEKRIPTILDWQNERSLAEKFPKYPLFSPPTRDLSLPYLADSIDLIIIQETAPDAIWKEARRVAKTAVVCLPSSSSSSSAAAAAADNKNINIDWQITTPLQSQLPSVSIIIPFYNNIEYTEICLKSLQETLPSNFRGEIIIVDDASTEDTYKRLHSWLERETRLKIIRNEMNQGYILACNKGAEAATGEYILFLNNDTILLPGWLKPLLQIFVDYPDAGAAGGQLIYPNGLLQEAGNVIFSDASGINMGKWTHDVEAPLYNFVRPVDYCSGALLLLPRQLFLNLGAFDLSYLPAYYEDADICFTLRQHQYQVYYQPESRIVHFEGISHGSEQTHGITEIKKYQVINREKFSEKWRTILIERHPAPIHEITYSAQHKLVAHRSETIKNKQAILFAPFMPEFDRESGSRRIFHFIEFLQANDWQLSYVAQNGVGGERYAHLLRQRGVTVYTGFDQTIDELLQATQFDLAIFSFWYIAEAYLDKFTTLSPKTYTVIDSIDLHFLRHARQTLNNTTRGLRTQRLDISYGAEMTRELNAYAQANGVLAVSQKEADYINDLTGQPHLSHMVPLCEDMPPSPYGFSQRAGILFIGNFRHPPNLEAIIYFCEQIYPLLNQDLLEAHPVYIVGNKLDDAVLEIIQGLPYIEAVGWVPSLLPYLHRSRLTIAPLLHGAGTKGKLIQALTVGTPSVSTNIGIEGLALEDQRHVWVADDPIYFAQGITSLLNDGRLWQTLSEEGIEYIGRISSRATVEAQLMKTLETIMGTTKKGE